MRAAIHSLGLLLLLVAVAGCMSTPKMNPPVKVRSSLAAGSPVSGLTVVVEEFTMDTTVKRHDGPTEWLGLDAAQQIARGLEELGARAVVSAADAPVKGDIFVRGRLTKVNGGSKAARRWAGFGAGGAYLEVTGTVTRENGELLGEFTDQRRSAIGSLESTHLLERCAYRIGRDVATMIVTGSYKSAGGDRDPG